MGKKICKCESCMFRNGSLLRPITFLEVTWRLLQLQEYKKSSSVPLFALTPVPVTYSKRNTASTKVFPLRIGGSLLPPLGIIRQQAAELLPYSFQPQRVWELKGVVEKQKLLARWVSVPAAGSVPGDWLPKSGCPAPLHQGNLVWT